jgi:aspartyl-tRNA(Asn)/glutamyl-tRNA(Gln) amidotransferase subunit B
MRDLVNAGALDLVIATAEAGASPEAARSWWVSYLAQQANTRGVELTALPITPAQVAEVVALIDNGTLNNKVARQVVDRVLDGEGDPKQVVANHPEFVVERDDTKLKAAVDEALAANPDIADKIRGGKVAAAGKIVGDVMKATRGQADPARVKELVIEACS